MNAFQCFNPLNNANEAIYQVAQPPVLHETFHIYKYIHLRYLSHRLAICIGDWQLSIGQDVVAITCLLTRPESHRLRPHQSSTWPWPRSPTAPGPGRFIQFHLFSSSFINAPLRGRNQATVECFGSFTKLLTSLIAEWYGVWQEVAQVQQGSTLLVLGWVTACWMLR